MCKLKILLVKQLHNCGLWLIKFSIDYVLHMRSTRFDLNKNDLAQFLLVAIELPTRNTYNATPQPKSV